MPGTHRGGGGRVAHARDAEIAQVSLAALSSRMLLTLMLAVQQPLLWAQLSAAQESRRISPDARDGQSAIAGRGRSAAQGGAFDEVLQQQHLQIVLLQAVKAHNVGMLKVSARLLASR